MGTLDQAFGYQQDSMNLPVADVAIALPFYERVLGFSVTSRGESPRSATLARDSVQIRLVEHGGDPAQDGCAFYVTDVQSVVEEFKSNGLATSAGIVVERRKDASWNVFYLIAPDGLCYWFGERDGSEG